MSIQAQLNQQALEMLPNVLSALEDNKYSSQMRHSVIAMICNSHKPIDSMSQKELSNFEEEILEYFNDRQWIGDHPDPFRFEHGSLFEYNECQKAYVHCYKRAGCKTMQQAISEYTKG